MQVMIVLLIINFLVFLCNCYVSVVLFFDQKIVQPKKFLGEKKWNKLVQIYLKVPCLF